MLGELRVDFVTESRLLLSGPGYPPLLQIIGLLLLKGCLTENLAALLGINRAPFPAFTQSLGFLVESGDLFDFLFIKLL